jgi:glycosyltransferase involved in cell wall biosynthesis
VRRRLAVTVKPRATIIVPTFNHGPLLRLAVESARRQSERRLEIIIIGDGATPATHDTAVALAETDERIRYCTYPKDSSKGERHRHEVLARAQGEIVCYLADDDLWTATHIETMLDLLLTGSGHDFGTTLMVRWTPAGALALGPAGFVQLARPVHRRLFMQPTSGFASGLSAVAHTLAFYRSLPRGWHTTPAGIPTDGWMWRQCLEQEGTRAISLRRATVVNFHSPPRRFWPIDRRLAEMSEVFELLNSGTLDSGMRRLEELAGRPSTTRRVVESLWVQLHRAPALGAPAMRLASLVLNRPAA